MHAEQVHEPSLVLAENPELFQSNPAFLSMCELVSDVKCVPNENDVP